MATGEHVTEWSTTAACTPAGADAIGSTLDDELRQLKATLYKTDRLDIVSKTAAYTSSISDFATVLSVAPSSATLTVSLAAAATMGLGWRVKVRHAGTAHGVLIDGSGTETLGGSITYSLTEPNETVELVSNGSDGYAIASDYVPKDTYGLPSGTRMLFQQTSAPTGWTKDTGIQDDTALRVTTGNVVNSTGNDAFSTVFGTTINTGSTTLTAAQSGLPSHTHTDTFSVASAGAHTHSSLSKQLSRGSTTGSTSYMQGTGTASSNVDVSVSSGGSHSHTLNGSVDAAGGTSASSGHTHTMTMDLDYYDVIVATKD